MREAQEIFFDEKNWKPALHRSKQLVINTLLGIAVLYDSEDHGLSTHSRADLRPTAYRMDTFQRLIEQNLWGLELPLIVRGREISLNTLSGTPKGCYEGPIPGNRQLALQSPVFRGLDVRLAQLGLSPRRYRW